MAQVQQTQTVSSYHRGFSRYRLSQALTRILLYALLIVVGIVWALPFVWITISSLKPESDILTYPIKWIPNPVTFEHYIAVLSRFPLLQWFWNSVIVSTVTVVVSTTAVCLGAYALACMRFRGRNFIYLSILASFLLPAEVTLVPLYLGFNRLHLLNSYFSLISVGIADAFNLFLLTQFFQVFPVELEEAARIDGCSRLGVLWRILLPVSRPALITVILFRFFATWNDFTWPLIAIDSDTYRTLPVGIVTFIARSMGIYYGVVMSGAVLACIPALIIFFFLQRYFVQGIATTGIK